MTVEAVGSVATGGTSAAEATASVQSVQPTGSVEASPPSTEAKTTPGVDGTNVTGTESPYTPSLKYKVLDKEKDFPDWAKGLIKDQNLEKSFRDIFEKADGIDHIKSRRDSLENENKQMKEHWAPVVQSVQAMSQHLQKKDLDSVFEMLGIPEIELFKYVNHRLQLRENPQALQAHETQRQLQLRNTELEQRVQSTESMAQEMAVQRRSWELDMEISKPNVSSAIEAFEARVGRPGSFKEEVIRRGQAYAAVGQDIPASQAVQEVLALIGWQGQQTQSPTAVMQQQPLTQESEVKATLPNIRGKGTSPTKVVPKSVADLRKLARDMRGL